MFNGVGLCAWNATHRIFRIPNWAECCVSVFSPTVFRILYILVSIGSSSKAVYAQTRSMTDVTSVSGLPLRVMIPFSTRSSRFVRQIIIAWPAKFLSVFTPPRVIVIFLFFALLFSFLLLTRSPLVLIVWRMIRRYATFKCLFNEFMFI